MFLTLWADCYLGRESASSHVWSAEKQNKPPFNKCLRRCILQRSNAVVVPEDFVLSFLYQQIYSLSSARAKQGVKAPKLFEEPC